MTRINSNGPIPGPENNQQSKHTQQSTFPLPNINHSDAEPLKGRCHNAGTNPEITGLFYKKVS